MKITEVRIRNIKDAARLKAVASVTFGDSFVVHGLRIIEGDEGFFIGMPSRERKDGSFADIAHPINNEFRKELEETIIEKYDEIKEED